jgi:hypothetical protein
MSEPHSTPGEIVRWETLPGLPGDCPIPKHFHLGRPTPWSVGFVVRFWNVDGTEWVGNFQIGVTYFSGIVEMPAGKLLVIVARGACYFLPVNDPETFRVESGEVINSLLSEEGSLILGHPTGEISFFDRTGTLRWSRNDLGADELVLRSCASGVVVAYVQDWEGNWRTVRLAEMDGSDLE